MPVLTDATLSDLERRVLDRFLFLLERETGPRLRAVWLYGSRARGEEPRDSDVDLLVIAEGGRGQRELVSRLLRRAERDATGEQWWSGFSVVVQDPAWLADRRAIGAFFIREVDRDKVVLYGDAQGGAPPIKAVVDAGVRRRTREYLDEAHKRLRVARLTQDGGFPGAAINPAYYAMLNAARAALSEEDLFAKMHRGTWMLFRREFVRAGRFDAALVEPVEGIRKDRIEADYNAREVEPQRAEEILGQAERFVESVATTIESSERR